MSAICPPESYSYLHDMVMSYASEVLDTMCGQYTGRHCLSDRVSGLILFFSSRPFIKGKVQRFAGSSAERSRSAIRPQSIALHADNGDILELLGPREIVWMCSAQLGFAWFLLNSSPRSFSYRSCRDVTREALIITLIINLLFDPN